MSKGKDIIPSTNGNRKRIHITTLGCSKNVYDSEMLIGQLRLRQADLVDAPEDAEVVIINTCGFIDLAKQESIDAILEAEQLKREDPSKKIIVCGCLSQRYGEELKEELTVVDAFFGTEDYQNILKFLDYSPEVSPTFLYENRQLSTPGHYAYLKISEGCNHTCAFCAIPIMRGRHRSRPMEHIIEETKHLAENGVKEVIIISQDTTFYGVDLYGSQKIVTLLHHLQDIEGIEWIRLHYLYPTTVQDELIELMGANPKIVSYLDMPIQHISDRMLAIMKRGGSSKRIKEIFENAREKIPDVTIRTTLIVGHPGETEEDFQLLKQFVGELKFDRLGIFTYSHEEDTPAYAMEDLDQQIKEERYRELMELQQGISLEKNLEKVGKRMRILIDEVDWGTLTAFGRTEGDSPEIDNEVIIEDIQQAVHAGEFVPARILDASEYQLFGKIEVS